MIVPISYGPYQKFLARITQDPRLDRKQAVSLPRMSFEILSMSYDGARKTNANNRLRILTTTEGKRNFIYTGAPYNLEFNLYVMTKYAEDGTKILEQITPFFQPDYTFFAHILDELPAFDIPLVLNSISAEDIYEGDFETRRSLMWTLSFTMKAWYFGPIRDRSVIKFVDTHLHQNMDHDSPVIGRIMVQPGLTEDGEPTTDPEDSVPYQEIEFEDDWGVIVMKQEYLDGEET